MIDYSLDLYYTKFIDDCEFEKYRQMILNDPSPFNKKDFSHEKLRIKDQDAYCVVLRKEDAKPVMVSGLAEVFPGVGRMMNRHYTFPDFRSTTRSGFINGIKMCTHFVIKPLYEITNYNTHILTMANRRNDNAFFELFVKAHQKNFPGNWHKIDGYVKTGNGERTARSWQNAITDNPDHHFETINHDQWLLLD